ncbi:MAG: rRNA maturation RNase YbeY [Gammaproteobacteria bacterium]|nr:rRNA maturation RNase YbeY [Gammaproteobacteria bacterium]
MSLRVTVQRAMDTTAHEVPTNQQLRRWAQLALHDRYKQAALTIRIVESEESAQLNQTYRHKSGPTNVLSFPCDAAVPLRVPLLGDVVICAEIVAREALAQHKTLESHWAHMVIHGSLHLQGYDHITPAEADTMEGLEIHLLEQLGFGNPYQPVCQHE